MRAARTLVVFLILTTGCTSEPEEIPAQRLLDVATEAEVRWPRPRVRQVPDAIDGLRGFRELRAARIGRVAMFPEPRDGDSRLSLIAPAGTRYDFELTPPTGGVLEVSLGYVPPEPGATGSVRFSAFLTVAGGGGQVLLDREIAIRADGDWSDERLDLSAWAGQKVSLALETRADDAGTVVWAAWGAPEIVSPLNPERGPDVILISLDTLRADRLGSYGYERPTSPNLDALAARSVRFATAVSQAPWTRPSHDSMFSGLYPSSRDQGEAPVLAEVLRARGFRTEALTGGGQTDFRLGFGRGFDAYRVFDWLNHMDELGRWLDQSEGRRRFLFLHTYEIHDPYTHTRFVSPDVSAEKLVHYDKKLHERIGRRLTTEQQQYVSDLYDGGIAYTDEQLGKLFEIFEARGVFDRAIVIVTSDHGEQFWEHGGWRHGMNLYDEQLLVPLIVSLPPDLERELAGRGGLAGTVIEDQVRLVDLFPTVMDLLGASIEHRVDGRSLRPLFEGGELAPVDAFAERLNIRAKESKALRSGRFKYVFSFPKAVGRARGMDEARELYDLGRDPGELENLAEERPEVVERLDARLKTLLDLLADPSELDDQDVEDLDPDLRERLEALGYIGG